jgi:hypothetical protein
MRGIIQGDLPCELADSTLRCTVGCCEALRLDLFEDSHELKVLRFSGPAIMPMIDDILMIHPRSPEG